MAAARQVPAVNVCAFIMTHGIVIPEKNQVYSHLGLQPFPRTEYTITATPLPSNITLYAPAILGYSYYEDNQTENVVKQAVRFLKRSDSSLDIASAFLLYLKEYRNYKISRLNERCEVMAVPHGHDRSDQLDKQEALTVRTQLEWRKHSHFIKEKEYQIYPDQDPNPSTKLPSCIMIYCDNVREMIDDIIETTFNDKTTSYASENGEQIKYTVTYDKNSSIFTIDFGDTDADHISFDDITFLIKNLILSIGQPGIMLSDIKLSIFDLTCDDLLFQDIIDTGQTSVLLSSDNSPGDPTLVYGTIQTDRASEMERETHKLWPSTRKVTDSYQTGISSVSSSPSPSHSHSHSHSHSPSHSQLAVRPSNIMIVHLNGGVESFVNFELLHACHQSSFPQPLSHSLSSTRAFESPSLSVASSYYSHSSSPGGPAMLLGSGSESESEHNGSYSVPRPGGGSRHSHRSRSRSRRRSTKREVYRKNGRNSIRRRRRTKARSKTKGRNTKRR
jgi:hypothetical protein